MDYFCILQSRFITQNSPFSFNWHCYLVSAHPVFFYVHRWDPGASRSQSGDVLLALKQAVGVCECPGAPMQQLFCSTPSLPNVLKYIDWFEHQEGIIKKKKIKNDYQHFLCWNSWQLPTESIGLSNEGKGRKSIMSSCFPSLPFLSSVINLVYSSYIWVSS